MAADARILVVDDDPINGEVLSEILNDRYEVLCVDSGAEALLATETFKPDLILLDIVMPGLNGYEVCERLKRNPFTAHIPVIFITALGDIEAETRGLEVGAVDYVTKPISPPVVRVRVRNHIELFRARNELAILAMTDSLTGLANRRRFDQALEAELVRLRRLREKLSLIMLDLDYFKPFNDTYGHVAGDHCLRMAADVLSTLIYRAPDLAARYGGEEFACILPQTDHAGALSVAERIRSGVAALEIPHAASSTATSVTVSIGVVTMVCRRDTTPNHAIEMADRQLYRAKENGRNQIAAIDVKEALGV